MIKNLPKNSEFNHFTALANDWWAHNSKFKILHQIIPLRIEYILSIIMQYIFQYILYIISHILYELFVI